MTKETVKAKVVKACSINGKVAKAGDAVEVCKDTLRNLIKKGLLAPA
jgi:hypothetical protein